MSILGVDVLDKFDAQLAMVNSKELAAMLSSVSVEAVAQEAGVSTKTIYRLRNQSHSPRLDTVERIMAAVHALAAKRTRRPKVAA